jgi:hypothetical protein
MKGQLFYSSQKGISNGALHAPIRVHLTLALKGFVVGSQILNLILNPFFYHNSCISSLNKQCEGTLGICTSRILQWSLKDSIWCLFGFSTKVLNIWDFHTGAILKMGMHLGIIGSIFCILPHL